MPLVADDALVTRDALAAWLAVDAKTLDAWHNRGVGPPRIKLGTKAIRYRRRDVERWLAASTQPAA